MGRLRAGVSVLPRRYAGRLLFAVDDDTLELEDGRLVFRYAFEGDTIAGISVFHFRPDTPFVVRMEERRDFSGTARVAVGNDVLELNVVDSSDFRGTFKGVDLERIRVHGRVSVKLVTGSTPSAPDHRRSGPVMIPGDEARRATPDAVRRPASRAHPRSSIGRMSPHRT